MPDPRPIPRTTTDELLLAVLDELQGLRSDLAGARGGDAEPVTSGRVEMREPAQPDPAPVAVAASSPTRTRPIKRTQSRSRREA